MVSAKDALHAFKVRYLRAGLSEEFDSLLNLRIWVCNIFGLALGSVIAGYIWIFWIYDLFFLALLCIPLSLFYLLIPAMNRRGFTNFTRMSSGLVGLVVIFFYAVALGPESNVHLLFLLSATNPFLLFLAEERGKRWLSIFLNATAVVLYIAYFEWGGEAFYPISSFASNVIGSLYLLTVFFLIMLVTYFFFFAGNEADARLKKHLGQLGSIVAARTAELTRANKELKNSEEKFRAVVTNVNAVIFAVDLDGNITLSEGKGLAAIGLAPGEAVGYSGFEMYKDYPEIIRGLREALSGNYHHQIKQLDDVVVDTSFSPIRNSDGTLIGVMGITLDVTDQERAKAALKESEEVLRATFESMKEGVIIVAEDGLVSHFNKRFTQIWSLPEDALAHGKGAELFKIVRDQLVDPEAFAQRIAQLYQTDKFVEDELHFKDGRIVHRTSSSFLKDGKQGGRAWFFEDITDKKRMEEMLVQAEKMGSLGELAAGMAHEINNPLAGIVQNAEVAKRRLVENIPANTTVADQLGIKIEDLHRYMERRKIHLLLDNIHDAGDRAARIVSNMLVFSRKSAGQFEPYPIAQLIEETIELAANEYDLEKNYDFRKITIQRNFDSQIPAVVCEKAKLQQVFLNLLKNAAHALAESRAQVPRIEITTKLRQKMVHIVFEDNGPGFDQAVRRRVFEPFFTTKDVGEGTGLGLSVSYFIVTEDHQGQMMVESEKGRGAKFTVVIPVVQPKRAVV
ncbi:MAG: PAS domain S-box protein [Proteobacteria bacterium]|nr:PAS domain S-box protein [Pseudomonadota bacterium]